MSVSIERRLKALEDSRGGDSCDVCGWGPHIVFEIDDDPDDQDPGTPEYCPACGRPNTIVITWPDQEDLTRAEGGGGRR